MPSGAESKRGGTAGRTANDDGHVNVHAGLRLLLEMLPLLYADEL
jgi:hypothetical protein